MTKITTTKIAPVASEIVEVSTSKIRGMIYSIRNQQVMFDFDLAQIYGYEVRAMNQQVKRNSTRFPEDFMFQLTQEEVNLVKSQIVTSSNEKFFPSLKVKYTKAFHDRFLILDRETAYHVGASIKDAGKKCFGINLIQDTGIIKDILQRLELETEE